MRKCTLLLAALVATAGALAVPAWANGKASGDSFSIAVDDFPDHAYLGEAMYGTLSIKVDDDGSSAAKAAQVLTYVDTPLGRAVLSQSLLALEPGQTRVLKMRCDVGESATTGPFTFGVQVLVDAEALRVEHEVYLVGGK